LVDYSQEVNWFALEQFVKECQFLNETGINLQYMPEYMIRNDILLKGIFQSEGNISSQAIETKHPCLENVKLVFDEFLDKFLAKYLEIADAIFENNKYNKTERSKDIKNWRRNKLLYKKYSEILVIPMDVFENITRIIKKSGFEGSSIETKSMKTKSLKTFIYNDFLDNKRKLVDTLLYNIVVCFVEKLRFEDKSKEETIEEKKKILEELTCVLNTIKFTQNYDKDVSDLLRHLNSSLEPFNTVSK
jgi:hypothetical protein